MSGRLSLPGLRVGSTSWVTPGTLAENLRRLARDLSDMELVLFHTPDASNIPTEAEVRELAALCNDLAMTCTVHLPAELDGTVDEGTRRRAEDLCLSVMDRAAPLDPFGWVVHLTGPRRTGLPAKDMDRWRTAIEASAARLAQSLDDPSRLCVETLGYNFRTVEPVLDKLGLSVCLDVGHLVFYELPARDLIVRYLPQTRILHLHGVGPDGADHRDLRHVDPALLDFLLDRCAADGAERVLTVEVFGEEDYEASLNVLKKRDGS